LRERKGAGFTVISDRILPAVRSRLEERKLRVPLAELEARGASRPSVGGSRASFAAALRGPHVALIAEVKRASPSAGLIRPHLQVEKVVCNYAGAGAKAISVLTEEDHFLGSLADLATATATTELPVLRKDFIIDEYQVYEAWAYGASAILLIAALLTDSQLRRLIQLAGSLGLDVLLEVHDRGELERALSFEGVVIGINNRDLRTFHVSLDTTLDLARLVPPELVLVAESGIRNRSDLECLARCGVDAVLVGEALLRGEDEAGKVRELVQPPLAVRPRNAERRRREAGGPAGENGD